MERQSMNEVMPETLNEPAPQKKKEADKRECLNEPAPTNEKITEDGEAKVQLNS